MNKYESISDWLKQYTPIGSWLYFNVTNIDSGETSLNSVSGPKFLVKFIDGSGECELNFSIDLVKNYDTGTSDINIEAMTECTQLIKWCEMQVEKNNLPNFSDHCVVNSVEITTDIPSLSIDTETLLAKYQILGKVNYLQLKGE